MGKLIRCITSEGAIMVSAVDSTDIVAKAEEIHKTSAVTTAALGRMLTAAAMTYVAALAVSLAQLLRFFLIVASSTRRRD